LSNKLDFYIHLLSTAKGPGGVLKLPQQAWAEPGHQMGVGVHRSKMCNHLVDFHDFPGRRPDSL